MTTYIITDAFTDTNGTALDDHTPAPVNTISGRWRARAGGHEVQSNKAAAAAVGAAGFAISTICVGVPDYTISVTVNLAAGETAAGVVVRMNPSDGSYYRVVLSEAGNTLRLIYHPPTGSGEVEGFRDSASVTVNASTNYVLTVTVSGGSITATGAGGSVSTSGETRHLTDSHIGLISVETGTTFDALFVFETYTRTSSYQFVVDTADDGTYATNLTAWLMEAQWDLGFPKPFEPTCKRGRMSVTLDNSDGRFSPENTSGAYYADGAFTIRPNLRCRMYANAGHGDVIMWTGVIDRLRPDPGAYRSRRAVLEASDNVSWYDGQPASIDLQADSRADEIIYQLLQAAPRGPWLLGVEGASNLGVHTRLGGLVQDTSFETGQETFDYAGDWFSESTNIMAAVQDCATSEGLGRFYFRRDSVARFWDRSWQQKRIAEDCAFDADSDVYDADYTWGDIDEIYNEIIVKMEPRVAGSPGTVVYEHKGGAIEVPANSFREMKGRFVEGSTGVRIAAATVIAPVAGTDYTVNEKADGSGVNYTNSPYFTIGVQERGDGVELTFRNTAIGPLYITFLQVRGTPLVQYDPEEVVARDTLSRSLYGLRSLTYPAPLLNNVSVGHAIAKYMLRHRKDPRSHLKALKLRNATTTLNGIIVNRTIGDVVRVSETQTALADKEYFIVGESHRFSAVGKLHEATWTLEPKADFQGWLLGVANYSELGVATTLGV